MEIRIRKAIVSYQEAKATRKARAQKHLINRHHVELATQAQRKTLLEQAIKEVAAQIFGEKEESELELAHQLTCLSKLAADLQK